LKEKLQIKIKSAKTIQPQIKGNWNADETLIRTKRGIDRKNKNSEFDYV